MLPIYTRFLTPADYGALELLTLVTSIVAVVMPLGITSAVNRFYYEQKEIKERNEIVNTAFWVFLLLGFCAAILGWTAANYFSDLIFNNSNHVGKFRLVFLALFFQMAFIVPFVYLRLIFKSVLFIVFSLIQMSLGLSLNILFVVSLHWGIDGVLLSMLISNSLTAFMVGGYMLYKTHISFSLMRLREMVVFGSPLVPASLAMFVLNVGDRFILKHYSTVDEIGIYALGYKIGMLITTFIGSPFLMILSPKATEIYEGGENVRLIFGRILTYSMFVAVWAAVFLSVCSVDIISIVATGPYRRAADIVPWIALGGVFLIAYYIFQLGVGLSKQTKWSPLIVGSAAIINVVINFLVIPVYGATGAAMSTTVSFFVLSILAERVSGRLLRIDYEWARLAKMGACALIIGGLCAPFYYRVGTYYSFLKILLAFSFPCILMIFNFFTIEEKRKMAGFYNNLLVNLGVGVYK